MPSTRDGRGYQPSLDRATVRWLLVWGITVWAGVGGFIRLAGHRLLDPTTPLVVVGFFAAVVPLMALVTYPVYRRFDLPVSVRPLAASIMSLPGMFLDVGLVVGADLVFPAMPPGAVINFGAVLLFGYAVVLLTGFVPLDRPAVAA